MQTHRYLAAAIILTLAAGLLFACGEQATQTVAAGTGPDPVLPPPNPTLLPTVNIATVTGWAGDATPVAAPGLRVAAFATGLDHPRNLYVLPNRDVLAVETNAPKRPEDGAGLRGFVMRALMRRAGAGVPSPNRIILLRDSLGTVTQSVFLEGLNSPYGVALIGHDLYVANTDSVMRYPYIDGATGITAPGVKVADLPGGPIDHHWTKNLVASADGRHLHVSIGSNSNVGENGIAAEEGRAAIWDIDPQTGQHRILASGLRNPNGLAIDPATHALWTSVNERDEIGSDLVPDYMTAVQDGGFYGWPYSYFGQHVDTRAEPQRPDLVARAIVPDYALGPHTASLGLAFCRDNGLPPPFTDGVFVGQHGSWNRRPPSGYKVIFVPFASGKPAGLPLDVLTGFLDTHGNAQGRPVGVACDGKGGLLVADDVGNRVWRVTGAHAVAQSTPSRYALQAFSNTGASAR